MVSTDSIGRKAGDWFSTGGVVWVRERQLRATLLSSGIRTLWPSGVRMGGLLKMLPSEMRGILVWWWVLVRERAGTIGEELVREVGKTRGVVLTRHCRAGRDGAEIQVPTDTGVWHLLVPEKAEERDLEK